MKNLTDKQKELLGFVDSQIEQLDKTMTKIRHNLKNFSNIRKYFEAIRREIK